LWDVTSGRELHATKVWLEDHLCAFSPDGKLIASAADDNQVKLCSCQRWSRAFTRGTRLARDERRIQSDGNSSLSGSEDDSLRLWDVVKGQEVRSFHNGLAAVMCVAFSPDGRFGLSAAGQGREAVESGQWGEVAVFGGHTQPVRSVPSLATDDLRLARARTARSSADLNTGVGIARSPAHAAVTASP